jgi:protein-S-isoprenylcysteine O-methyltransferase Ste14
MWVISRSFLVACWFAWFYPFLFLAPHHQKRQSITVPGPTRVGLALESLAIFLAFIVHRSGDDSPPLAAQVLAMALGIASAVMAWQAVRHLGRQFRLHAGLYHDHELVRTGPYAIVRHPIYASLFGMLVCSMLILTPWMWFPLPLALFIAGTEIRVRSEDALLASRFGAEFHSYRKAVAAYIPYLR